MSSEDNLHSWKDEKINLIAKLHLIYYTKMALKSECKLIHLKKNAPKSQYLRKLWWK